MKTNEMKYSFIKNSEKLEIFQKLPKCDTETTWANAVGKNGAYRLTQCRVATNLQFVKNAVSTKRNKAKHNRRSYDCSLNFQQGKHMLTLCYIHLVGYSVTVNVTHEGHIVTKRIFTI